MAIPPTPLTSLLPASQPWNGPELLQSLHRLGVAHDLQESDLTLPDLSSQASSSSSSSSSMSMLLSRLSLLLSDLGRLQETQIRAHLPALLESASNVQSLETQVRDVRQSLNDLELGVEKLANPTRRSLARLQRDQERFKRLNAVQDLLRQASQYVTVARRLETHLQVLFDDEDRQDAEVERAMVESAHCLESLGAITNPPLSSLQFIQSYTPSIQSARAQVIDKMEACIVTGLRDLSPSLLSSSLQTADILGVLPDLVSDLLHDLTDVVRRCVVRAVGVIADRRREWEVALSELHSDGGSGSSSSPTPYRSKRAQPQRSNTTTSATAQLQDAFCQQLHTLMTVEMTAVCSKIYLLQRVLGLMSAARRGVQEGEEEGDNPRTLLDEGVKILGEPPTLLFWRTLSTSLESNLARLPPTFLSTPVVSATTTHQQPAPLHTNTRIHYHPTWHSHLSRMVDFFFEKTAVWTGIAARGDSDRAPEEVFVRRSMGLA